jgi:hypothetical protein
LCIPESAVKAESATINNLKERHNTNNAAFFIITTLPQTDVILSSTKKLILGCILMIISFVENGLTSSHGTILFGQVT